MMRGIQIQIWEGCGCRTIDAGECVGCLPELQIRVVALRHIPTGKGRDGKGRMKQPSENPMADIACRRSPGLRKDRTLRPENEVNGQDETDESGQMVPLQGFVLAEKQNEGREYNECYYLLYDLQLPQRERPAVFDAADTVCRYLEAVFEQGYTPAHQHDKSQGDLLESRLEDDVPVPSQRHEGIGTEEHQNGKNSSRHVVVCFLRPKSSKKYDLLSLLANYSYGLRINLI